MFLFLLCDRKKPIIRNKRRFPYVPVLSHDCKTVKSCYKDYFDLVTINPQTAAYKVFKKCLTNYEDRVNNSNCIRRINSYAKENNPDANYIMGMIYEYGVMGQEMNDTIARKYFETATSSGHKEAMAELAFMLRYGFGGEQNIERSLILTNAAMRMKSVSATLSSIFMLQYGHNMPQSHMSALKLVRRIGKTIFSNLPFPRENNNPGVMRLHKKENVNDVLYSISQQKQFQITKKPYGKEFKNVEKLLFSKRKSNPKKAEVILKDLINYDSAAFGYLGLMYQYGIGVDVNPSLAYDYFSRGFHNNDPISISEVIKLDYIIGSTITFFSAVENFHPTIIFNYAMRLIRNPTNTNLTFIAHLMDVSASKGNVKAIFYKGFFKSKGLYGYPYDKRNFLDMMLAIELSPIFDDSRLAYKSFGKSDFKYSLRLYQRLADWGSEAAMWNSQQICEKLGLDSQPWFDLQVALGFHTALKKHALNMMKNAQIEEGIEILRQAAYNDDEASYIVGNYYFGKNNFSEGFHYFQNTLMVNPNAKLAVYLKLIPVYIKLVLIGTFHLIFNIKSEEAKILVVKVKENFYGISIFILTTLLIILSRIRLVGLMKLAN